MIDDKITDIRVMNGESSFLSPFSFFSKKMRIQMSDQSVIMPSSGKNLFLLKSRSTKGGCSVVFLPLNRCYPLYGGLVGKMATNG